MQDVRTQFEFYEGIRILIPGTVLVATAEAVLRILSLPFAGAMTESGTTVTLSVFVAGLLLYMLDVGSKSAVFRADQPNGLIREWLDTGEGVPTRTVTRAYFYLLDVYMPANIRSRALYMGSIFRIG